tara:strand:- start:1303 stop:2400 length:1098 start_codon:yes stop_codon:yes gene_type:complete
MALTSKIENYTNTISSTDAVSALDKGVDYVISTVASANPQLLNSFAVEINTGVQSMASAYDWQLNTNSVHLLDVIRGESGGVQREVRKIKRSLSNQAGDSSSIYYALAKDPVYWFEGQNKIKCLPDVGGSTSNSLRLLVVPSSNGRTVNSSNETVEVNDITIGGVTNAFSVDEAFPKIFQELLVLHASECILMERLVDFRTKLPTDLDADQTLFDQIADVSASISYTFPTSDFDDAIAKAKNLIDGTTMSGDTEPESVQYWLADEDEDMVQVTLATASQELARANAYLGEFNAELGAQSAQKQQALAEFQANLSKKIQLFNTVIQKIQVEYQWMTQQLQLVNGKKKEFIATNVQMNVEQSPERKI